MSRHRIYWYAEVTERYSKEFDEENPEEAEIIDAILSNEVFDPEELANWEGPATRTDSEVNEREFDGMFDSEGSIEA